MKYTHYLIVFVLFTVFGTAAAYTETGLTSVTDMRWSKIGELPAPEGYNESIGVSATYAGYLGDYLIVAGGANFPNGHPFFDSGKKAYYSDVFVFTDKNDQLELVAKGQLPFPAGYGATINTGDRLLLVGGKNENGELDSVIELSLEKLNVSTKVIAKLPFTWSSGGAAWHDNALFIFSGSKNGMLSNDVCKYSLKLHQCIDSDEVKAFPGTARIQFPFINRLGKFYLFGGLDPSGKNDQYVLSDSFYYHFESNEWQSISTITAEGQPVSVAGGGAALFSEHEILLLGGVDKHVFGQAVQKMKALTGNELNHFKQAYFSMSENEHHFSRRQLIYNMKDDSWTLLNKQVPFSGGAGPLSIVQGDSKVFWVSGEVMPVKRDPSVYRAKLGVR